MNIGEISKATRNAAWTLVRLLEKAERAAFVLEREMRTDRVRWAAQLRSVRRQRTHVRAYQGKGHGAVRSRSTRQRKQNRSDG